MTATVTADVHNPVDVILSTEGVESVTLTLNSWIESTLHQKTTVSPAWVYQELRQRCYDMYGNMSYFGAQNAGVAVDGIVQQIRQETIRHMQQQIYSQYTRATSYNDARQNGRPAITNLPLVFPDTVRQRQLPGFREFKYPKL